MLKFEVSQTEPYHFKILNISWKWKDWWTSCTAFRLPNSFYLQIIHFIKWIASPLLKKFKQVRRESSLVEVITSINNELLVVSKTSNFLFGCVLEFASHVNSFVTSNICFLLITRQNQSFKIAHLCSFTVGQQNKNLTPNLDQLRLIVGKFISKRKNPNISTATWGGTHLYISLFPSVCPLHTISQEPYIT